MCKACEERNAVKREQRIRDLVMLGGMTRQDAELTDDMSLQAVHAAIEALEGVAAEAPQRIREFVRSAAYVMTSANMQLIMMLMMEGIDTHTVGVDPAKGFEAVRPRKDVS